MELKTSINQVSKSLSLYAKRLERLDIKTVEDLLYHLPFRYEDFSLVVPIGSVQAGETVTIQGKIKSVSNAYTRFAKKIQTITIEDNTGHIDAIWFNQPYLLNILKKDETISLSGQIKSFKGKLTIQPKEYEILYNSESPLHTGRLVPIYPETRGVSSKWLRRQVHNLLNSAEVEEILPQKTLEKFGFAERFENLKAIHFPKNHKDAENARKYLSFEELFILNLKMLTRRASWAKTKTVKKLSISGYTKEKDRLISSLPFDLTKSQIKAVGEILSDLESSKPMNRLLQGDVGSGKTVVAAIAMYLTYKNGLQSVLMAPTEILATQHHKTISSLLEPFGVKVGLITGSKKLNMSRQATNGTDTGILTDERKTPNDILVGTHALLEKKVEFPNLGLVVVDEQQRFGVVQRGIIREKGRGIHFLTMTATPIPRTAALTLYGELDLSMLTEMPKDRKAVKTWLVPVQKREDGYKWIEKEIKTHKTQAFIICPFIEESESMQTVKAAKTEFEMLRNNVFPSLRLALLHGKLKSGEKDEILDDFRKGKYDILVATPVVEVGIDIPSATIIVIEASERFGLSQLHQLRGRVGRGDKQSYCLLFTESKNPQTLAKLKAMEKIQLGSELSELDLRLRGPGELYGKLQSGQRVLKVASFSDLLTLENAKREAKSIFPRLSSYKTLAEKLGEDKSIVLPD